MGGKETRSCMAMVHSSAGDLGDITEIIEGKFGGK